MTAFSSNSENNHHPIFYLANQIYQFSNAMPLYNSIGGTFIVKKILKRMLQYKKYLRNTNVDQNISTLYNTPPSILQNLAKDSLPAGIVISMSNIPLIYDALKTKTIFVGHGAGDKKYGASTRSLEAYDYHFLSGPKHLEKIRDVGLSIDQDKLIRIGNMRFDDYVNNKINRQKVLDRLGIIDQTRKNILYTPTWKWGNGTFHKYVYEFAKEISKEHNLIVRPHYHDRPYISKVKLWAKFNGIRHVYFSNPADVGKCDTMEDFLVSDLMISDTSSILYEYLITRKPIIVAQTEYGDLHSMPDELNIMRYVNLYNGDQNILTLVNKTLLNSEFKDKMEYLLHQCFYYNDGKSVQRAHDFINSISI
ncbi:CDP-glycerol glycerophosphotransferase family protein [bacterium]|nr:CDP-glycerol glycerophosphotransferase family protein [bacterium]